MGKKALSEQVKGIKKRQLSNLVLQKAVDAYKSDLEKPKGDRKGATKIAREHGIPLQARTILNHAKGKQLQIYRLFLIIL